jgi:hypothetical protein
LGFRVCEFERASCEFCGAVQTSGRFTRCCREFQDTIRDCLADPVPLEIWRHIKGLIANGQPIFPRSLNRDLLPVIRHAKIALQNTTASSVFLPGTPYAIDSYWQFITLVYAIFNTLDRQSPVTDTRNRNVIKVILGQNPLLQEYMRDRISDAIEKLQCKFIGSTDTEMNIAIMNAHGISAQSADWEVLHTPDQLFFDQLSIEISFKEFGRSPIRCHAISRTGGLKRLAIRPLRSFIHFFGSGIFRCDLCGSTLSLQPVRWTSHPLS